jgi:prevent-host-death family protein
MIRPHSRSPVEPRRIGAGEFKQRCLQLMDEVAEERTTLIITKRGVPVAKLVPVEAESADPFGSMRGTVAYLGDIVSPDRESWGDDA